MIAYLDIDGNGLITREEFMRQMTKGENLIRQTIQINKQIADKRTIARRNQTTLQVQSFGMPTNPWVSKPQQNTIDI